MNKTCGVFVLDKNLNVLACHPTNHPPDVWSIPKGEPDEEDEDDMWAAIREFNEETGVDTIVLAKPIELSLKELEAIKYRSGKKVLKPFYMYIEGSTMASMVRNADELECESYVHPKIGNPFPEVDDHKWLTYDEALKCLHETQVKALQKIKNIEKNNS